MKFPTLLRCFVLSGAAFVAPPAPAAAPAPKRVALVIDDGPDPRQNAALLAILARERVRVTFSHVGKNVAAHPDLAKAAAAAGHEIINHSYTHPHLKQQTDAEIEKEAADTSAAIKAATGRAPAWFWAPFLEHDARVDTAVRRATGLEHFPFHRHHFIGSLDWEATTTGEKFRALCTTGIVDGTVILLHEWPTVTLANLPAVIAELKKQGAEFVTFSQLQPSR
ncbi:MAG: polysaccharide deacetylase family protein [Verrucomicrobia bacterium]|nr:polysaccharide deacetylase family protein [Verrucomicrobiota bacterium]